MLVLSRKVSERIHIGNDIFIEVRRVAGNRVTLAINAPKNVRILRGELLEAARAFDVLDDSVIPAESTEATTDTLVMSREDVLQDSHISVKSSADENVLTDSTPS